MHDLGRENDLEGDGGEEIHGQHDVRGVRGEKYDILSWVREGSEIFRVAVLDEWTLRERCLEREGVFSLDLSVWVEVLLWVRDEDFLGVVRER